MKGLKMHKLLDLSADIKWSVLYVYMLMRSLQACTKYEFCTWRADPGGGNHWM